MKIENNNPLPVKILGVLYIVVGIFALVGSVMLWGKGFILTFPDDVDLALPFADILVNVPASIIAGIGLWRLRRFGYVAAQFCAGLYIYASVMIFADVVLNFAEYSSGEAVAIVIPQLVAVVMAIISVIYLWRVRNLFDPR